MFSAVTVLIHTLNCISYIDVVQNSIELNTNHVSLLHQKDIFSKQTLCLWLSKRQIFNATIAPLVMKKTDCQQLCIDRSSDIKWMPVLFMFIIIHVNLLDSGKTNVRVILSHDSIYSKLTTTKISTNKSKHVNQQVTHDLISTFHYHVFLYTQ